MTEYDYIKRATLVGDVLSSGDAHTRFREMTGEEAYFEFLRMVGSIPAADVAEVRRGRWIATAYTTTSKRGRIISNVKYTCSECEWVRICSAAVIRRYGLYHLSSSRLWISCFVGPWRIPRGTRAGRTV